MIPPSLALSNPLTLSVFPLLVHRRSFAFTAHSSSATAGNARTLQCALNCTPPSSSCLRVFTSSGRNSRKGDGKGERESEDWKRERERERTPKLNCRGKWQATSEVMRSWQLKSDKGCTIRSFGRTDVGLREPVVFLFLFLPPSTFSQITGKKRTTSAAGHRFEVNDVLRCVRVAESLWLSHCLWKSE